MWYLNVVQCVLRLGVSPGSNVSPICVPDEEDNEDLDASWSCVTAGWGVSKAAGSLHLKLEGPDLTKASYNKPVLSGPEPVDPERLHHVGLTLVNKTSCREKWGALVTDSHICSHPAGSISCMVTGS